MRAALLAITAMYPFAAFGQSQSSLNATAQMIMSSQQQQVPGGECYTPANGPCNGGLVPITFQPGDVVLQGSVTDAQGNVWSLNPDSCNGNQPSNWWSGEYENGQLVMCGYGAALRNVNGTVWYEEAKGSGWRPANQINGLAGPYVTDPGQGTGSSAGGQETSAPVASGSAADTTTAASDPPTTSDPASTSNGLGQSCPGMTLPGAVTPSNGTFTANGNTYSIDATDSDVASINGAPINAGAYETSQLVQGSNGTIYGQSNAAANNGQWFMLQGGGNDTWWQPSSAPPVSTSTNSAAAAQSSTDTTAQDRVAPTVCPQIATIQSQIGAANQQITALMAQQAALVAQQQQATPTTTTIAPADSTLSNNGTQ